MDFEICKGTKFEAEFLLYCASIHIFCNSKRPEMLILIENALKPYILLYSPSILPLSITFLATKLKLSHCAEVRPGLFWNHASRFWRTSTESFYPRSARRWQAKKPYNILFSSEKSKSTGLNALLRASKDLKSQRPTKKPSGSVCPASWILTVEWPEARFQITSLLPATLGKQCFQTVSFSNRSTLESVFKLISFRWSFPAF